MIVQWAPKPLNMALKGIPTGKLPIAKLCLSHVNPGVAGPMNLVDSDKLNSDKSFWQYLDSTSQKQNKNSHKQRFENGSNMLPLVKCQNRKLTFQANTNLEPYSLHLQRAIRLRHLEPWKNIPCLFYITKYCDAFLLLFSIYKKVVPTLFIIHFRRLIARSLYSHCARNLRAICVISAWYLRAICVKKTWSCRRN